MKIHFADTYFWVASIDPNDPWHDKARSLTRSPETRLLVTSEDCLAETLNFFSNRGPRTRMAAMVAVRAILVDPTVEVYGRTGHDFQLTLNFYESRPDKGYSFVDCLSMILMRKHGIHSVLTGDRHFAQEGFDLAL